MIGWNDPKYTREDRAMRQKAVDDAQSIKELLYSILKFTVETRMSTGNMKPLQQAIEAVASFQRSVQSDLD